MQRRHIGYCAKGNEVEQREQVRFPPVREKSALAQQPHRRHGQQECDPDSGKVPMRGSQVILVQSVGVHQRRSERQLGGALVVIDHDHVDPGRMRHFERLIGHRPAIDGHDQARPFGSQPHQRLARRAISFKQPVRDVIARRMAQHSQQPDQQRRAGRAVNIVVTVNSQALTSQDRLRQSLSRHVHVAEGGRVRQERPQRGIAVPLHVIMRDAARQQQLGDQIVIERGRAARKVHVAAAPAPGPARQRALNAKDGGWG